jgi:hypothetical protein
MGVGPAHGQGERVEQQEVGVVPQALLWLPWAVGAEAVPSAGFDPGYGGSVPSGGVARQRKARFRAVAIEEAELDQVRRRGVDGDVGPR